MTSRERRKKGKKTRLVSRGFGTRRAAPRSAAAAHLRDSASDFQDTPMAQSHEVRVAFYIENHHRSNRIGRHYPAPRRRESAFSKPCQISRAPVVGHVVARSTGLGACAAGFGPGGDGGERRRAGALDQADRARAAKIRISFLKYIYLFEKDTRETRRVSRGERRTPVLGERSQPTSAAKAKTRSCVSCGRPLTWCERGRLFQGRALNSRPFKVSSLSPEDDAPREGAPPPKGLLPLSLSSVSSVRTRGLCVCVCVTERTG